MKNIFFVVAIAAFSLISCQKEIDWGAGKENLMLVRAVQRTGADSVVITYSYDGSKRLIMEKTVGMSQGINVGNEVRIIRNGSGIITQAIQKSEVLVAAGIDSVIINYQYNTSTNRYTAAVFDISLFGFTVRDSAVYQYDSNGNITTEEHYQLFPPLPYMLSLKMEYTYTGNNLTAFKQYSFDPLSMSFELISTINYTYDSKATPLKLAKEAIILARPGYYGNNNPTRTEFIDANNPTNNFTDDVIYSYDITNNKPLTGTSTRTPGAVVTNITYYYQ